MTVTVSSDQIQEWLIIYMSKLLNMPTEDIDVTKQFDHFGLDSTSAVGMSGDLGNWLNRKLDPSITGDYPTIETISNYIAETMK